MLKVTPAGKCSRPGCGEPIGQVDHLGLWLGHRWHANHAPDVDTRAQRTWTRGHNRGTPDGMPDGKLRRFVAPTDLVVCPKCAARLRSPGLTTHAARADTTT
jgi:hypothetical protein